MDIWLKLLQNDDIVSLILKYDNVNWLREVFWCDRGHIVTKEDGSCFGDSQLSNKRANFKMKTLQVLNSPWVCLKKIFNLNIFCQVHTNGSHQNGKRGSHVSTVSIYRQEGQGETAMGGKKYIQKNVLERQTFQSGEEPEPGIGMCGWLLTSISWFLVIITLPFSLCVCFKVTWHSVLTLVMNNMMSFMLW